MGQNSLTGINHVTLDIHGRTLIVLNPQGVSLRRSSALETIHSVADGQQVVLLETEYAGHAGDYCREHAANFDKVIAVGGDGMLMDVVNGALDADVAVAPYPAGTACDFVKAAPGYPASLQQLLASRTTTPVDLGRVTFDDGASQYFVTEAGVGLDAASVRYIPGWLRRVSSKRAYDVGALRAVLWFQPFQARVTLDDQPYEFERLHLLAVCSAPFFGDGMPVAPDAKIDDGQFHVYAAGNVSKFEVIRNLTALRKGKHIEHPKSVYRACRRVEIEADRPLEMCFDGDLVTRTPRTWEIQPGRLKLIVPV